MIFNDLGNKKEILFEDNDSNTEKRILEQGLAFIKSILTRCNELRRKK
jgi:hypothetical protein